MAQESEVFDARELSADARPAGEHPLAVNDDGVQTLAKSTPVLTAQDPHLRL